MMPSRKVLAAQVSRALHAPRACSCPDPQVPVIKRFLFLQLARSAGDRRAAFGSDRRKCGHAALLVEPSRQTQNGSFVRSPVWL